jgi:hypothetical protein
MRKAPAGVATIAAGSADNMTAIRDAAPSMPDGFDGRLTENYMLLFGIADLAGGDWPRWGSNGPRRMTCGARR